MTKIITKNHPKYYLPYIREIYLFGDESLSPSIDGRIN